MATKQAYLVLVGLNYPPDRRAEPGDIVTDLPAASVPHELEAGHITPVATPAEEEAAHEL